MASTRQVVLAAFALVALGTAGALRAGFAGSDFMLDLEQAEPALAKVAPSVTEPHTPRLARRVFLVIVDGLRLDKSYGLPYLDELRRKGVDLEATSHYPTYSRPNYVSILTGVPPMASGVRTNHHWTPVTIDSLMDRIHGSGMRVATATDYDALPRVFLRPRGHRPPHPDDEDAEDEGPPDEKAPVTTPDADLESPFDDARYAPWPGGFVEAGAALVARGDADLVILLVGAADAAGHAKGGASKEYRAATINVDHALQRAFARVDLTQDAIIVTADHGHTNRGGHGGTEPEVMSVPLIIAGAGVKPSGSQSTAQLIDVAPTAAALLGIAAPGHGLGKTLVDVLAIDDATKKILRDADTVRLAVTRAVVETANAHADALVLEHRTRRIGIVVAAAVLSIALAGFGLVRRVLRFPLKNLFVVAPAFFIAYFGLIATLGQRFSPSLLPANAHMAGQLAKFGAIAMLVQIGAAMWVLRGKLSFDERLAQANGIAWVGLMLTMVPAGLLWALFPPPYETVPGPVLLVMIPAVEVAVAAAAGGVTFMLLIELIVFGSRALVRPARQGEPGSVQASVSRADLEGVGSNSGLPG